MQEMVRILLDLDDIPRPDDAADARGCGDLSPARRAAAAVDGSRIDFSRVLLARPRKDTEIVS